MANLDSPKKEIRKTKKRTLRNQVKRDRIDTLKKEIYTLSQSGEKEKAEKKLQEATKAIDKAAKNGFLHKNTASRYKSRLAKAVNKAESK